MNKKIEQLAEQAGWIDENQFSSYNKIYQWQEFDKAKFADLLIQDILGCYQAIDNGCKVEGTANFVKAVLKRYKGKK